MFSAAATFTVIEWLALTGLAQTLLILVYIILRMRSARLALPAVVYFSNLALSFFLQFALRLDDYGAALRFALWLSRTMGPLLCYLLVFQAALPGSLPAARHFRVLLLAPAAAALAFLCGGTLGVCADASGALCPRQLDWLRWWGAMTGAVALLALWARRGLFGRIKAARGGRERYWLSLALVAVNAGAVLVMLAASYGGLSDADADALFSLLGISFAYLATTVLFRVYPSPVPLSARPRLPVRVLSEEERVIADQIRRLMEEDKVYQEQAFSRADLARELKVSENTASRVINKAFGKSFPRLLGAYRVEDAKALLRDPAIPIQMVAFESGFNSLASFNRVFREETGETPSAFRAAQAARE